MGWYRQIILFYLQSRAKKIKFIIKGNKVKAFQFSVEDSGRAAGSFQSLTQKMRKDGLLSDKDFGIAGFKLDTKFRAHSWDTWQRKMSNPKEDVWYFPDMLFVLRRDREWYRGCS